MQVIKREGERKGKGNVTKTKKMLQLLGITRKLINQFSKQISLV